MAARSRVLWALGSALLVLIPLQSAAAEPAWFWYRASKHCPTDVEFLDELGPTQRPARVAKAGDPVDFVVTLMEDDAGTLGRLERQSDSGKVALTELRDSDCARVAKALALSLGLVLDGSPSAPVGGAPDSLEASAAPAPGQDPQTPGAQKPRMTVPAAAAQAAGEDGERVSVAAAQPAVAGAEAEAAPNPNPSDERPLWVGLTGGAFAGFQPRVAWRVEPRVALGLLGPSRAPLLAVAAGLVGGLGSHASDQGRLRRWLLGGSLEGCSYPIDAPPFAAGACLGLEVGSNGTWANWEGASDDTAPWLAGRGGARAQWMVLERFGLTLDATLIVPLLRQEVFVDGATVYETKPLGFYGALGLFSAVP
jgi:hypothetical protein